MKSAMPSIVAIIALSAVLFFYDFPRLRREGQRGELWTFSLLLVFGAGLAIAQTLNVPLPNPMEWIMTVFGLSAALLDAAKP